MVGVRERHISFFRSDCSLWNHLWRRGVPGTGGPLLQVGNGTLFVARHLGSVQHRGLCSDLPAIHGAYCEQADYSNGSYGLLQQPVPRVCHGSVDPSTHTRQ